MRSNYLRDRLRIVLRRANVDKLLRSSPTLFCCGCCCCPCNKCVCEFAAPSWFPSMLNEFAREAAVFSMAAISSKQLKNDCFWMVCIDYSNIYMYGSIDFHVSATNDFDISFYSGIVFCLLIRMELLWFNLFYVIMVVDLHVIDNYDPRNNCDFELWWQEVVVGRSMFYYSICFCLVWSDEN